MRMRYAGKCMRMEWRARRPIKTGRLLAPPADCAYAWPAPEWARFRFSSRRPAPRAGNRRTGTGAPRLSLPGPGRAGLLKKRAPATTGMRIHQQPPAVARANIGRIRTRARAYNKIHVHPRACARASRIRFPINIAPGHAPVPGPASAANNPGPGSARPRRPRGILWQKRIKTAPPKLISSLFFCPLRLLWKKCRISIRI